MAGETEWEDALIKHGIMRAPEEKETEDEICTRMQEEAQAIDHLAGKTLQELGELEDEVDDDILISYRRKRLKELQDRAARNIFGTLQQIGQADYKKEVTESSKSFTVVVHLFELGSDQCALLNRCLEQLAHKFQDIKFLKVLAQEAIENFPRENCPTLLVYKDSNIALQLVKLLSFAGQKTNADVVKKIGNFPETSTSEIRASKPKPVNISSVNLNMVEWVLSQGNVLKTDLEVDPRQDLLRMKMSVGAAREEDIADDDDDDDSDW